MKRRIVFLDVDGTLTGQGCNEPPESAVRAISQARKNGHLVFLCTGRNFGMLRSLLPLGFDGAAASSGGYIVCGDEVLYDCPLTKEQQQKAMEALEKNGIFRTVECKDASYIDESFREYLLAHPEEGRNREMLLRREQLEKSLHILPMSQYRGQPVYKIVALSPSAEQLEEPRRVLASEFAFCIQNRDDCGFVNGEFVNREFHKGKAVRRICEHYGIPLSDSAAIGDSMNDLEMLKTAGIGLCMENGSPGLKKAADGICPSVEEDGIWSAFCRLHLIEKI